MSLPGEGRILETRELPNLGEAYAIMPQTGGYECVCLT